MILYPVESVLGTEALAPFALNAEAASIVSRSNRLDRDALAAKLPHSKVALDAYGRLKVSTVEAVQTATVTNGKIDSRLFVPIPNATGASWAQSITHRGGYLEVSLVCVAELSPINTQFRGVLLVNGQRVIGPTVSNRRVGREPVVVLAQVPVSSGLVTVEPYLEVKFGDSTPFSGTITFRDRRLLLWEACR